jgi:hypothetical protein
MTKSDNQQIKDLYEWWNGWVFSFEKIPETSNIDDAMSSGMDEAIDCIDDSTNQQGFDSQEDLMEGFNNLAVSMALPVLSTGSSRVPQPADLHSFAPGPSHTRSEEQPLEQPLEDEDIIIPEVSQPLAVIEDEIQGQNSKGKGKGKGKEKAVNIDTGGVQDNLVTAGGRQRRKPKKYDSET